MAELTNEEFYDKWVPLLADNVFQDINGARFQELLADMRDSFASLAGQSVQPVPPAVNFDPQLRQLTAYHPLGASELEYTHNNGGFSAYAPIQVDDLAHPQAEWRFRVKDAAGRNASQLTDSPRIEVKAVATPAGPGTIKAIMISDSTEAGRALLTATDVAAQRLLLDKLNLEAAHFFPEQPKFDTMYGEDGALAYILRKLGSGAKPAAPVNGHADDTSDIFYGTVKQANPALGDYEIFYPGSNGNVPATNGRADLVGSTLTIRGLVGPNPPGSVGMRRAANGNIPASDWLTNVDAFTGTATPAATGFPYTFDFELD
jgi:hypothetical protein